MRDLVVFIVEDDPIFGTLLEHSIKLNEDYSVFRYATGKECLANLYRKPFAMTLDYSLPDMNGREILRKVKETLPDVEVVMISGQEDITTAVGVIKEGAYDYFEKKDIDIKTRLWNTLNRIRNNHELKGEVETLREALATKFDFDKVILGKSPAILGVFSMIEKAIKTNITVTISGDTGTGKELVAKAIHFNSVRKKKPFIAVNMAAIPKDLLESELFGFEKGSFTHALARKPGKFEQANGGTLFLDEIGDMDVNFQAKLLRVIQERELVRIGGTEVISLDIRFLVATNLNLAEEVRKGNFREDLYFRLLGLQIHLPPLRERNGDVLILAKHFADEFCKDNKFPKKTFTNGAKEKLLNYAFPGNVRELKAVIDLAVVMANSEEITEADILFPSLYENQELIINESFTLNDYIRRIISSYLVKYHNNMTLVAEKLDVGKSTLYRMRQNKEI
jgi:DNA-binding NtrC family response regulator